MRKVIYSDYVQNGIDESVMEGSHMSSYSREPHMELQEQGEALFHQWGLGSFQSGGPATTSAIIELEDGTVKNIPAEQVRFISGEIVK